MNNLRSFKFHTMPSFMRFVLFAVIFIFSLESFAQGSTIVSGSYTDQDVKQVLLDIENQTGLKFYFDEAWLDSLQVTATFQNTPIKEALDQVFEGSNLNFHVMEDQVFLTKDTRVIDQPDIIKAIAQQRAEEAAKVPKGLVFAREYLGLETDKSNLEEFVFEVGSRKDLVPGTKSTIAGYVKEADTGEPIVGAVVYSEEPFVATTTDYNGFYSLTLPPGKNEMMFQYAGMETTKRKVVLYSSGRLDVNMNADVIALQEVTIESDRDVNVKSVQMGVSKIDVQDTKNVPIVLGEKDIMKIATTYAGVQTLGEGSSGFNVRGGKSDQNLIMLNDATVYNASHFFGFFSVFNSDALQNMEIYKSAIPASQGGRLSSVFDIESLSADQEKFKGVGGISPITSKLTLEIPIIEGKSGLMVAGRSTYSNWMLKQAKNANFKENRVSFSDFLARYDHKINDKNDLMISGYYSKDNFRLRSDTLFSFTNFSFVNANVSAKWKHWFSDNFEGTLTAVSSKYRYELEYTESPPNAFLQDFDIQESAIKADMSYYIGDIHNLSFGLSSKLYEINPGTKTALGAESIVDPITIAEERGVESSIYFSEQYEVTPDLSLYGGIRYTMFSLLGPQTTYLYADGSPRNVDSRTDTVNYSKGEIAKTYHGPEWRLSARYSIDDLTSVKLSYNRTRQYIHTLSNTASLSPTDTWRLSNENILPQTADQYSLGFYRNFLGGSIETSAEVYYKRLQNLMDFKIGADFLLNDEIETVALQGPGKSYGVEFSIKKSGRLNGWLNYSYARTLIKLDGEFPEEIVNEGEYYPTNYDKPHTVNLVANWKLTRRLSFSYNFTYNTGRPVTYPVASYNFKGSQIVHYSDRNKFRIPDYMRMDFGISLEAGHKLAKLAHSYWSFSIYNLTGRDNPFSVFFDVDDGEVKGYKLVVFGNPIPTISYNFKF